MQHHYQRLLLTAMLLLLSAVRLPVVVSTAYAGTSRSERGALKVLYWATQGRGWRHQWDIQNEMSDPCLDSWHGIVCDRVGHIKAIHLARNNLVGSIPPEFARPALRFLKELDVSTNFLGGTVPDSFSHLATLRVLRLDNNWFVGRVPASLGQLTLLEYIELQGNQFDAAVDGGGSIVPAAVQALGRNGRCHLIA